MYLRIFVLMNAVALAGSEVLLPCTGKKNLLAFLLRALWMNVKEGNFRMVKKLVVIMTVLLTRPLRVLLADDDEEDRDLFREAIDEFGTQVTLRTADNGATLMDELTREGSELPDLIFLDLNMPLKNGHECLAEIYMNEKLRHIPVIIYSTSSNREQIEATYRAGASLYIPKPESFSDLQMITRKVLSFDWKNFTRPQKDKFVLRTG